MSSGELGTRGSASTKKTSASSSSSDFSKTAGFYGITTIDTDTAVKDSVAPIIESVEGADSIPKKINTYAVIARLDAYKPQRQKHYPDCPGTKIVNGEPFENPCTRKPTYGKEGPIHSHWKPDSSATKCLNCKTNFTLLRRKHHCRRCGYIFCSDCLTQTANLTLIASFERPHCHCSVHNDDPVSGFVNSSHSISTSESNPNPNSSEPPAHETDDEARSSSDASHNNTQSIDSALSSSLSSTPSSVNSQTIVTPNPRRARSPAAGLTENLRNMNLSRPNSRLANISNSPLPGLHRNLSHLSNVLTLSNVNSNTSTSSVLATTNNDMSSYNPSTANVSTAATIANSIKSATSTSTDSTINKNTTTSTTQTSRSSTTHCPVATKAMSSDYAIDCKVCPSCHEAYLNFLKSGLTHEITVSEVETGGHINEFKALVKKVMSGEIDLDEEPEDDVPEDVEDDATVNASNDSPELSDHHKDQGGWDWSTF
ncbi:unnamed protein product [Ambrosiozyma monospora]|uniref:Unnamed protein product n=1 Tax=Ambrosiozyma monospora TaxID=43982 RepID=A0ACB5TBP3_AMBMO|nr:unnamed protein product [Ambrosiozyma monospora]